ncbi:MAG: hypothetical protein NUW37_15950 [Planctomycetes bacterium]|nr:hypothetical protein [Planctomycetota bacterium]
MAYVGNIPLYGTSRWDDVIRDLRSGGLVKFHISYQNFSTLAPGVKSEALMFPNFIPVNCYVSAAWMQVDTGFADNPVTLTQADVDAGINVEDPLLYISGADALVGGGIVLRNFPGTQFDGTKSPANDGLKPLTITFTSDVDLNTIVAGELDVYLVFQTFFNPF